MSAPGARQSLAGTVTQARVAALLDRAARRRLLLDTCRPGSVDHTRLARRIAQDEMLARDLADALVARDRTRDA